MLNVYVEWTCHRQIAIAVTVAVLLRTVCPRGNLCLIAIRCRRLTLYMHKVRCIIRVLSSSGFASINTLYLKGKRLILPNGENIMDRFSRSPSSQFLRLFRLAVSIVHILPLIFFPRSERQSSDLGADSEFTKVHLDWSRSIRLQHRSSATTLLCHKFSQLCAGVTQFANIA